LDGAQNAYLVSRVRIALPSDSGPSYRPCSVPWLCRRGYFSSG